MRGIRSYFAIAFLFSGLMCMCDAIAQTSDATSPSASRYELPEGTKVVIDFAYEVMKAYQEGDEEAWNRLICMANEKPAAFGLKSVQFIGEISNPRLLVAAGVTSALNASGQFQHPVVRFEVKTPTFPNFMLTFVMENETCGGMLF